MDGGFFMVVAAMDAVDRGYFRDHSPGRYARGSLKVLPNGETFIHRINGGGTGIAVVIDGAGVSDTVRPMSNQRAARGPAVGFRRPEVANVERVIGDLGHGCQGAVVGRERRGAWAKVLPGTPAGVQLVARS